jgi:hypothetical protein
MPGSTRAAANGRREDQRRSLGSLPPCGWGVRERGEPQAPAFVAHPPLQLSPTRGERADGRLLRRVAFHTTINPDMKIRSRGTIRPRHTENCSASKMRGRRECRVRAAPAVSCAKAKRKRTRAYRFSGGNPTFPARWPYGLSRALPGDQDLFVTVAPRMMVLSARSGSQNLRRDLTPTMRRQDHTLLPYALAPFVSGPSGRSQTRKPALQPRHPPDAAASTASHAQRS